MRKITLVVLMTFLSLFAFASGNKEKSELLSVVTSIYPMEDFARKAGGDKVNVISLLPPGAEAHEYELKAKDILALEAADVFIYNGASLESWVPSLLSALNNPDLVIVEASKGIDLIETEAGTDPHLWLSPKRGAKEFQAIAQALIAADGDAEAYYLENEARYLKEFELLDKEYEDALSDLSTRVMVVTHEAFGYLASDYNLEQVAIEGLSAASEPTAYRMAEIERFIKENEVGVIFSEAMLSDRTARALSSSTGAQVKTLNPLETLSEEEVKAGDDYFSVMRANLETIVSALR